MQLFFNSAIPFLGIDPTSVHTHTLKIYTGLFITALYITAKDLNGAALNGPTYLQFFKKKRYGPNWFVSMTERQPVD